MKLNAPNGLTIKEFKEFLKDLPETDAQGIDHTISFDGPMKTWREQEDYRNYILRNRE